MKSLSTGNLIFALVLGFLSIAVIWIMTAELDEVVRAEALVEPEGQVQIVQSRYAGVIANIGVRVGQQVGRGEPLVTLESTEANAALEKNQLSLDALRAEIDRLTAEAAGLDAVAWSESLSEMSRLEQLRVFVARLERRRQQDAGLVEEIRALQNREIELQSVARGAAEMVALKQEEVALFEPLVAQGIEPSLRLLMANQELQSYRHEREQSEIRLAGIDIELGRLEKKRQELRLDDQSNAQEQLVQRESEWRQLEAETQALKDRVASTVLKAPVAGIVTKVYPAGPGAVVSPAEPLVELIPLTGNIQVQAKVLPQDISSIFLGQEARIGLSAYDYTVYGVLMGQVAEIAQNTAQSETGEVYYEVTLVVDELRFTKSEVRPLAIPGMLASVDIAGDKRTVLDYVMKPMRETSSKALTEK